MDNELSKLLEEFFGKGNVEIIAPNRLEKTMADMISQDPKKRLKAEYQQVLIRYQNLCSLIKREEVGKEKHQFSLFLLKEQREVMRNYLDILVTRAGQEGWDLI